MNDTGFRITASDIAEHANCDLQTVYRAVRAGRLRAARVGNRLRFRPEWVSQWLEGERNEQPAATEATV